MKKILLVFVCMSLLLPTSAQDKRPTDSPADNPKETLRQYADQLGIRVGVLLDRRFANQDPRFKPFVGREFNAAESFILMKGTQPERGRFNFKPMDRDIEFAKQYDLELFATTLVYKRSSSPEWLVGSQGQGGGGRGRRRQQRSPEPEEQLPGEESQNAGAPHWSKDELDRIMKDHIYAVMRHGGDAYYAWEVVNEPLSGPNLPWGTTFSMEDYTARAFRYAHEANPNAKLMLDQSFRKGDPDRELTDKFFDLVKKVRAAGSPVDMAGIEMHLEAQEMTPKFYDAFRYFLDNAKKNNVEVHVTEMDVYQGPPGAFPDPMQNQRKVYHDIVSTCLEYSGCTGIYFWGVADSQTWLRNKPRNARPDAKPLLFDDDYGKKPAYYGVLDALKEAVARRKGSSK